MRGFMYSNVTKKVNKKTNKQTKKYKKNCILSLIRDHRKVGKQERLPTPEDILVGI